MIEAVATAQPPGLGSPHPDGLSEDTVPTFCRQPLTAEPAALLCLLSSTVCCSFSWCTAQQGLAAAQLSTPGLPPCKQPKPGQGGVTIGRMTIR